MKNINTTNHCRHFTGSALLAEVLHIAEPLGAQELAADMEARFAAHKMIVLKPPETYHWVPIESQARPVPTASCDCNYTTHRMCLRTTHSVWIQEARTHLTAFDKRRARPQAKSWRGSDKSWVCWTQADLCHIFDEVRFAYTRDLEILWCRMIRWQESLGNCHDFGRFESEKGFDSWSLKGV